MNQPERTINRRAAANLLRATRAGHESTVRDAIEWAFMALPDSSIAQRMKIRHLIHQCDGDAADALLARARRSRPADRGLRLLQAQRQLQTGDVERAWRTIEDLIGERPHHQAALMLAATIARARHDAPAAALLLRRVIDLPRATARESALIALVEVHLEAGEADQAERLLESMPEPPAALHARLRQLQGRWLEVVDILESVIPHVSDDAERDQLLGRLIDALEVVGDSIRLDEVERRLDRIHPHAMVRAGLARLALGEFAKAARRVRPIIRGTPASTAALMVLHVAASMADRPRLAQRSLDRLESATDEIDLGAMARTWRCGIRGRLLADQDSAARSGADPESGVLRKLIEDAAGVFDDEIAGADEESGDRADLIRHRAACGAALTPVAA